MKDKALMVITFLLLQTSRFKSQSREHFECLFRRLALWGKGDFDAFVRESRIQSKLRQSFATRLDPVVFNNFNKASIAKAALRMKGAAEPIRIAPKKQKYQKQIEKLITVLMLTLTVVLSN